MSYFIFPQSWITPAITAAALTFGSLGQSIHVKYKTLAPGSLGRANPPATIYINKKPASEWPKETAQCTLAHFYGHLRNFTDKTNKADPIHSDNPRSIMYATMSDSTCHRWIVRNRL